MSRPNNVTAAVRELLADNRFTATWAMLTSSSDGERASALDAVTRQLAKRGLDIRDILAVLSGQIPEKPEVVVKTVEKVVERIKLEPAHIPYAATICGFITIIEELDAVDDRDGRRKPMLNVRLGTTGYTLEPILVIEPHLIGRCRHLHSSRKPILATLKWSGEFKSNGSQACTLTGVYNPPQPREA